MTLDHPEHIHGSADNDPLIAVIRPAPGKVEAAEFRMGSVLPPPVDFAESPAASAIFGVCPAYAACFQVSCGVPAVAQTVPDLCNGQDPSPLQVSKSS